MITGKQCRAARVLVEISRERLAQRTGIDVSVIEHFELKIDAPDAQIVATLKNALEEAGAVFIPDDGDRGAGVQLKFSGSVTQRIITWEGEGGLADIDDVP